MAKVDFYPPAIRPTIAEVVEWISAKAPIGARLDRTLNGVAPLDLAQPDELSFFDNRRYLPALRETRAGAVILAPSAVASAPATCVTLATPNAYHAMAAVMARLYPDAMRPGSLVGERGVSPKATVHGAARLEPGVIVDPGAVIGPEAEIGTGTVVGANAVIGPRVRIGRNGSIGPGCTVLAALIGDRVILHPGVHIGQDGFGFAIGPQGHAKAPQIGRVIIQDDVEIGAGTTIDRGANRDTVIGEGTKIDNLVQIGHNVTIGRHCVIVAQAGVAGSSVLEDFVALGGQAGIAGHLRIGAGAQVAAAAGVMRDVPSGQQWVGAPAAPAREFFRLHATLKRLASRSDASD